MTEQYVKENINKSKYYDFIWVSSASIVYSATLINFAAMLRLSKAGQFFKNLNDKNKKQYPTLYLMHFCDVMCSFNHVTCVS